MNKTAKINIIDKKTKFSILDKKMDENWPNGCLKFVKTRINSSSNGNASQSMLCRVSLKLNRYCLTGTHRVWLHLAQSSWTSSICWIPTLSCSQGASRHSVFKEAHLIWHFLLISKWFLKLLTVVASIATCDKLFQRLITRWEKKWRRQLSFTSFQEWPRVTESSALLKNRFHGTDDNCFTILKTQPGITNYAVKTS